MTADQCQEAKAGDAMKKIQELTALKDQHRRLRRQNSNKENGKIKAPISGTGEMPAELPVSHLLRESLWAQMLCSSHPEMGKSTKQTWTFPQYIALWVLHIQEQCFRPNQHCYQQHVIES